MSRSILHCKGCKQPVAVRHHSGRINVRKGVRVVIQEDGLVELRCGCGTKRVVSGRHGALSGKG